MKVSIPGMETIRSDHFLCLEKVSFSLVSAQKDCLTSLRCLTSLHCLPSLRLGRQLLRSVRQLLCSVRQLSFFSTTAANESGLHFRSIHGTHFPRPRECIFPIMRKSFPLWLAHPVHFFLEAQKSVFHFSPEYRLL